MSLNFIPVLMEWPKMMNGFLLTVMLTVTSVIVGILLSIILGGLKVYCSSWIRFLINAYVEVIRNTPFIVQIFFIFFGLPSLGIPFSPLWAGFFALVINLSAYGTEIVRSGIENIQKGQYEAAKCLALTPMQTFIHIILPQSLAQTWSSLVGQIIITMLLSAICSQISIEELSASANIIASDTYRNFEAYIVVTIIYILFAMLLRKLCLWFGQKVIFKE